MGIVLFIVGMWHCANFACNLFVHAGGFSNSILFQMVLVGGCVYATNRLALRRDDEWLFEGHRKGLAKNTKKLLIGANGAVE